MKLSMTCKAATLAILKQEENKLSFLQKIQLKKHLAICSLCRAFENQNALINVLIGKSIPNEESILSAEEKEKIISKISAEK